jgi:hypothetical protein
MKLMFGEPFTRKEDDSPAESVKGEENSTLV